MNEQTSFFADSGLPTDLGINLRRFNPWWENEAMPVQPTTRRHLVGQIRRRLTSNIAPIVVIRGPRQIGKTTAQFQIIQELLDEGVDPRRILRVQFDELATLTRLPEPILRISDWFERCITPKRFNALAQTGEMAYLFFDEIQNLSGWHIQLKSLVDNASVKVVVTGSSALRIELGRDSLAGRINTIEAGVLSLTEIGALRGFATPEPFLKENGLVGLLDKSFWVDLRKHGIKHEAFRHKAFAHFSDRGGYPIVHREKDTEFSQLADHLNETIIKRVIQHDLRVGERGGRRRDATLLEALFLLACRYAGQTPRTATLAEEIRLSLDANVGTQRITHYLRFLGDTLLLRLIPPLEIRLKRRRGSPKLCLVDHGLRASWLQEHVPLVPDDLAKRPELTTLAGHLAESIFGSVASTIHGLDIAHFPERGTDREVDFVLTVGERRIPVEIKYQRRIESRDTLGLRSFLEKSVNNASFGILVTQDDSGIVDDPRIVSLPLSTFMMLR